MSGGAKIASCKAPFVFLSCQIACTSAYISSHCFVSCSPSEKLSQAVVIERSASTCGKNAEVLTNKMKSWQKVENCILS